MKLTYQELEAKLHRTEEILARALEEIAKLHEKIVKLEGQINRNSKNSSKPPSTDQKNNTPENQRKPREPRAGKARLPFSADRIDLHVQCTRDNCPHCGSSAIELNGQPGERWQQAELPEVRAIVTEYELLKYHCKGCGKGLISSLPDGVPDSAFGPKLMGLLVTLTGVMHVAKREAIQLIKDLYDVDMSLGSVPNIEERVTQALGPIYDRIHTFVIESRFCKYFDETGWRDSGKRHFVWLASCEHAAVYMIDRTRSAAAFKRLTGKESWEAPAVTDRYGVYGSLKIHQYCLAHLIREFRGYGEREGPDKEIGRMLEKELSQACSVHRDYVQGDASLNSRNGRLGRSKKKVQFWLEDGMANGSDPLSKLCETLLDNFEKLWIFIKIPGMEPTNNTAERDLRKLVIWRKKSYGTRSERGKRFVERLTTVAQTLRKQGQNVLRYIQSSIENFYAKRSPSLICEAMGF